MLKYVGPVAITISIHLAVASATSVCWNYHHTSEMLTRSMALYRINVVLYIYRQAAVKGNRLVISSNVPTDSWAIVDFSRLSPMIWSTKTLGF